MVIRKLRLLVSAGLIVLVSFFGLAAPHLLVRADEVDDKNKEIAELEKKIQELQSQKQSISQTINYLSTKILLTEKEIEKTRAEIKVLSEQIEGLEAKIGVLDVNLNSLSEIMVNRIKESYKNSTVKPLTWFLKADGFQDYIRRYKYLKQGQQNDREVILSLEEARANYNTQKQIKEAKQAEVEALRLKLEKQQASLSKQQKDKQSALAVTRNDEKRYQEQLARALAEMRAIQSIIAGAGQESKAREVNEGDSIASIIAGVSACSSGSHLHFEVVKDKTTHDPAGYLSSRSINWDNKPDEPFGFSGSWRWPIDDPVRITQGYGMTFYAGTLRYYGGKPHTGIDMISDNGGYKVMAVKNGTLYRGAIACGGGTLRYVRVDHGDGVSTYYLHVNY